MTYITTAERLGREAGLIQGRTEGELLLLQRQLARKFGTLPNDYLERLHQANAEQLLEWADRILDAKTLSEVFG